MAREICGLAALYGAGNVFRGAKRLAPSSFSRPILSGTARRPFPPYSWRSASMGFSEAALCAG
jgi:hypothetical protein